MTITPASMAEREDQRTIILESDSGQEDERDNPQLRPDTANGVVTFKGANLGFDRRCSR